MQIGIDTRPAYGNHSIVWQDRSSLTAGLSGMKIGMLEGSPDEAGGSRDPGFAASTGFVVFFFFLLSRLVSSVY